MLDGLITIAGGILAASALIITRKPNAQQLIDKLTPYQGWIGVVLFFWGIWGVLNIIRFMSLLTPLGLVLTLAITVADLVVGFLLGFGLLTKYALRGNAVAMARGHLIRQKLATYQGVFGLLAIAMGVLFIVLRVIHIA